MKLMNFVRKMKKTQSKSQLQNFNFAPLACDSITFRKWPEENNALVFVARIRLKLDIINLWHRMSRSQQQKNVVHVKHVAGWHLLRIPSPTNPNYAYAVQQVINFHLNDGEKMVRQQHTKTETEQRRLVLVPPSLSLDSRGSICTCRTIQNWHGEEKKNHAAKNNNKLIFCSSGFLIAANERPYSTQHNNETEIM